MATTAEQIYGNFTKCLKSKNRLEMLLQKFKNPTNFEKLFELMWTLPESLECLKLPRGNCEINRKGKTESEKFRSEGNRLYKEKKFDKALLAYNYSILTAPHPQFKGDALYLDGANETLSLGFANRSALLFEMGEFAAAIGDIDRAINYGYPQKKSHKLLERKGKCYLSLQDYQKAETILVELTKVQDAKDHNKKNLEELIKKCRNIEISKSDKQLKDIDSPPKPGRYKSLFHTGPQMPPQPSSKVQLKEKDGVVQLSDLVQVHYTPEKGRHLLAARDLEPGVVLLSEVAQFSSIYLDTNLRSYCTTCLRRTPIVLPCPTCSLVTFCSETCLDVALHEQRHHAITCQILPILVALKPEASMILTFGSFSTKSLEEVNSEVSHIKENKETKRNHSKSEKTDKSNTVPDLSYLKVAYNYESLYHLEGNVASRTTSQLLEIAVYAVLLTRLLWKLPNYHGKREDTASIPAESAKLLGGQLMQFILNFQCNIHCIKELKIEKEKSINSSSLGDIGCGVYCALSLVNHGCAPNVLNSTMGNVKYMYTISSIPKGDEIVDSYGERFVSHSLEKRQKSLEEGYFFKCGCKACKDDWPMFDKLPMKLEIKCLDCPKGVVDSASTVCKNCKTSYGTTQQTSAKKQKKKTKKKYKSLQEIEQLLSDGWRTYEEAFKDINSYKTSSETIKKISKFITLMDKYTILPNKTYIEAQESLMRSYDLMGSQNCTTL